MLAKKTSKNQLTLPKSVVSLFPDVSYYEVSAEGDSIVLRPVRPGRADAVRAKLAALGLSQVDITGATRHARGKR